MTFTTTEGSRCGEDSAQARRPELVDAMVSRLQSPAPFVREVACTVPGRKGGRELTDVLLAALDDPSLMVCRAAGIALSYVRDPSSIPRLLARYRASANDDINVRVAMERALDELGAVYAKHGDEAALRNDPGGNSGSREYG